jgi:hypothetical protein
MTNPILHSNNNSISKLSRSRSSKLICNQNKIKIQFSFVCFFHFIIEFMFFNYNRICNLCLIFFFFIPLVPEHSSVDEALAVLQEKTMNTGLNRDFLYKSPLCCKQ